VDSEVVQPRVECATDRIRVLIEVRYGRSSISWLWSASIRGDISMLGQEAERYMGRPHYKDGTIDRYIWPLDLL
jgi:hypothetical protein